MGEDAYWKERLRDASSGVPNIPKLPAPPEKPGKLMSERAMELYDLALKKGSIKTGRDTLVCSMLIMIIKLLERNNNWQRKMYRMGG